MAKKPGLPYRLKGIDRVTLVPADGGWIARLMVHGPLEEGRVKKCTTRTLVRPNLQALFLAVEVEAKTLGVSVDQDKVVSAW